MFTNPKLLNYKATYQIFLNMKELRLLCPIALFVKPTGSWFNQ